MARTPSNWSGKVGRKRSETALAPRADVTFAIASSFAGTPIGNVNKIVSAQGENLVGIRENAANAQNEERSSKDRSARLRGRRGLSGYDSVHARVNHHLAVVIEGVP